MEQGRSRVGQLVRWHARKGQTYVRNVSIDLNNATEDRFGSVFGLFETETDSRTADALIAYIEDAVLRSVNDAMRKNTMQTREEIFEAAIYSANNAISRLLDERGLPLDPRKIKSVIISQKGHDVIMGIWGAPSVLLFHPSAKNGTVRVFDLVDDRRPDHERPVHQRSSMRGYTNVISGGIGKRDRLLISTEDPRKLINEAALSGLVIGDDPQATAEALKQTLGELAPRLSFASLVIDAAMTIEETAAEVAASGGTQDSIEALLDTTSRTRDILSPSFMTGVWRRMSGGFSNVVNDLRDRRTGNNDRKPPNDHEPLRRDDLSADPGPADGGMGSDEPPMGPGPEAPAPEKEEGPDLRAWFGSAVAVSGATWKFVSDKAFRQKARKEMRGRWKATWRARIEQFNGLAPKRKALLIGILVLVFVLNQGVALAGWRQNQQKKVVQYERTVHAIDQKLDSAEASIIYRDQERAITLLDEAEMLVAELPEKTDDQLAAKEELASRIGTKRDELRHVVPLEAPEVLATIVANGGDVDLQKVTVRKGVIWALDKDGDVYRTTPESGLTEKAGTTPEGDAVFLVTGTNGVIAGTTEGDAVSIAFTSGKASDLAVNFGDSAPSMEDVEVYGPRLYVLDAAHNRILKHSPYTGGYSSPSQYLQDGTDVSDAVSIAIDGNLYVLNRDGVISRLLRGVREDFGVQPADPPVTAAVKIRTIEGDDTIYVLDSSPARILAFSKKTGSLLAQYTDASLEGATDFVIEDDAIYVTARNTVLKYRVPTE